MSTFPDSTRRLQVELLETRTLFAADGADPFGLSSDLNLALQAVSGTGEYQASFDTRFGNQELVVTGSAGATLNIDLDRLPDFITHLKISSFQSVKMTGSDEVENLILSGVESVAADGLTVTGVVAAKNVGTLSIAAVGDGVGDDYAILSGSNMALNVRGLADNSTIISELKSLTLWSEAERPVFNALTPDQTLNMKYVPADELKVIGITSSAVHLVTSGGNEQPGEDPGTQEPQNPGGETPNDPGHGGTTDPVDDKPDELVIVTVPLDEKTRVFLDELRLLLHSSQGDADLKLLEFVNTQGDSAVELLKNQACAEVVARWEAGSLTPLALTLDKAGLAGLEVNHSSGITVTTGPMSAVPLVAAETFDAPSAVARIAASLPDDIRLSSLLDGTTIVPVAMATLPHPAGTPDVRLQDRTAAPADQTVMDNVRALGSYIATRVSAEFSPGQQSLVLLVDPQPSRATDSQRRTLAERLAATSTNAGVLPPSISIV